MFLTTTLVFLNQDKLFVSCQDKIRESNQCIFNRRLRIRIKQCQCFIAYFTHTLCSIIQSTRLFDHLTQYLGIFGIAFDSGGVASGPMTTTFLLFRRSLRSSTSRATYTRANTRAGTVPPASPSSPRLRQLTASVPTADARQS